MAQLTREAEERIVNLLLLEGLADSQLVFSIKAAADASGERVLDKLVQQKIINNDGAPSLQSQKAGELLPF